MISVIIPTYNSVQYLPSTIVSLQNQSYTNWEAIIVDDGSTDDTQAVCNKLIKNDTRIKYVKIENTGVSSARNIGIIQSRGEYIQLLDADDLLEENKFLWSIDCFSKNPSLDVIVSNALYFINDDINQTKYNIFDDNPWMETLWNDKKSVLEKLFSQNITPICCPIIKRHLFDNTGGFDLSFKTVEDWDFWLKISLAGANFFFESIQSTFALIRIRQNSLSQNRMNMYNGQLQLALKYLKQELSNERKENLLNLAISSLNEREKEYSRSLINIIDHKLQLDYKPLILISLVDYNNSLRERDLVIREMQSSFIYRFMCPLRKVVNHVLNEIRNLKFTQFFK